MGLLGTDSKRAATEGTEAVVIAQLTWPGPCLAMLVPLRKLSDKKFREP